MPIRYPDSFMHHHALILFKLDKRKREEREEREEEDITVVCYNISLGSL